MITITKQSAPIPRTPPILAQAHVNGRDTGDRGPRLRSAELEPRCCRQGDRRSGRPGDRRRSCKYIACEAVK